MEKSFFNDPCGEILIVRKFWKVLSILIFSSFELMFSRNCNFDFCRQGLNQDFQTSGRGLESKNFSLVFVYISDILKIVMGFWLCFITRNSSFFSVFTALISPTKFSVDYKKLIQNEFLEDRSFCSLVQILDSPKNPNLTAWIDLFS